jgi:hypothetical protein
MGAPLGVMVEHRESIRPRLDGCRHSPQLNDSSPQYQGFFAYYRKKHFAPPSNATTVQPSVAV